MKKRWMTQKRTHQKGEMKTTMGANIDFFSRHSLKHIFVFHLGKYEEIVICYEIVIAFWVECQIWRGVLELNFFLGIK